MNIKFIGFLVVVAFVVIVIASNTHGAYTLTSDCGCNTQTAFNFAKSLLGH